MTGTKISDDARFLVVATREYDRLKAPGPNHYSHALGKKSFSTKTLVKVLNNWVQMYNKGEEVKTYDTKRVRTLCKQLVGRGIFEQHPSRSESSWSLTDHGRNGYL